MLEAGDLRRRSAAQPPVAIRMCLARTRLAGRQQPHGVGVVEHRAALDDLDLGALERRGIGGFEPRDLAVLVGDQRRPVERRLRHGPAVAGGVLELVGKARGIDQELLRHAAADHAGAADAVFLGDHHARAVARRDARGAHAARARPDDEQIDVVVRHRRSLPRPPIAPAGRAITGRALASSSRRASCAITSSDKLVRPVVCAHFMLSSTTFGSSSISFLPSGVL